MKTYIVVYDLTRPGQNYTSLLAAIRRLPGALHFQQSGWLVKFGGTAFALRDMLRNFTDNNDKLLVAEMTDNTAWAAGTPAMSNAMGLTYRMAA